MANADIRRQIDDFSAHCPYSTNKKENERYSLLCQILYNLLDEVEILQKEVRKAHQEALGRRGPS